MANVRISSFIARDLFSHSCALSSASRRTFFASSTDHTTLLSNAKVHLLGDDEGTYGKRQYILVADNIPLDIVKKEPKLGLARLDADRNVIFGAKVINRTLGTQEHVCGTLLDAALTDASSQGEEPLARASLHGLCSWVERGIDGKEDIELLKKLQAEDEEGYEATKAIATGKPRPGHSVVGQGTFRDGKQAWEALATEFIQQGLGEEAQLYQSKGGRLVAIESLADTSTDSLQSAGGAMATFSFS